MPRDPAEYEGLMLLIQEDLDYVAESICEEMRENLSRNGNVDTGRLLNSIRYNIARDGYSINAFIYADATDPSSGAQYAEFLELGTGAAHGRAGGRVGKWRYKDSNGVWHTTDGMDASPFISPALENNLNQIHEITNDIIKDIEKYQFLKGGNGS